MIHYCDGSTFATKHIGGAHDDSCGSDGDCCASGDDVDHKSRLKMPAAVGGAVAVDACLYGPEAVLSSARRGSHGCRRQDLEKASIADHSVLLEETFPNRLECSNTKTCLVHSDSFVILNEPTYQVTSSSFLRLQHM